MNKEKKLENILMITEKGHVSFFLGHEGRACTLEKRDWEKDQGSTEWEGWTM